MKEERRGREERKRGVERRNAGDERRVGKGWRGKEESGVAEERRGGDT